MPPCATCGSTGEWACLDCHDRVSPAEAKASRNKRWYDANRDEILAKARQRYSETKDLRPVPDRELHRRETTLYRLYDRSGSLVYVGITWQFEERIKQHRRHSAWFDQVDHWTTETFPDRRRAKRVETDSIRREQPRFNRHESTV